MSLTRKLCQRGSNSDNVCVCVLLLFFFFFFFLRDCVVLVDEGKRILIPLKTGHHQPASETPLKWHFAGGPMMTQHCSFAIFQGMDLSYQYCSRNPIALWFFFFLGTGSGPPSPLDPRMIKKYTYLLCLLMRNIIWTNYVVGEIYQQQNCCEDSRRRIF